MRDLVVGMAGHIDHGKTTVVKYLTGVDTDTLPEEKSRGMTINLGFTQIKFKNGSKVGLVDVPGHEKFIKNMSAGVSGVDYLLLVVACDDGIMPQTEEHFRIAELFGVKRGMILLTKRDLVSDERFEEVKLQCREYFSKSFLSDSPLLSLSIKNPQDYEVLKDTLQKELEKIEVEKKDRVFRMDIDRVFSVKGFGCVVTGTIKSGSLKINDTLTIYPQNIDVRVKGIESHGEKREQLTAGNRCAINITGVDSDDIERGNIIAKSLLIGDRLDCKLTLLESSPKLKNNQRVRLNIGTDEVIGRVRIYEKNYILGGESAFVQLQLEERIGANLGDRGIVRNYSPLMTLGGIQVLFLPFEETNRKDISHIEFLKILSEDSLDKKIEELIKKRVTVKDIVTLLGEDISLDKFLKEEKIYPLDKNYIHQESVREILKNTVEFLNEFHQENSLEKGVLKSKLKELFFKEFTIKEYNEFLVLEPVKEKIKVLDEYVALSEFKIKLNRDEKEMKEIIFSYYKKQKFQLFPYSYYYEFTENKSLFEKVHRYMVEDSFIEYLEEEKYILKGFLKESIKIITEYLEKNGKITVKETRELLNNDRDSAILILRKLDSLKITKNIDGIRVLYK